MNNSGCFFVKSFFFFSLIFYSFIFVYFLQIQLNLNGQQQIVEVLPGEVKVIRHNGLQILHIKRFEDNVYAVHALQGQLMVMFCGKHVQIFGNPLLRARSCGLCGDLNAETTADLKTPER